MTNVEVTEAVITWLRGVLGMTVIKDRQSGTRPALPYAVLDLANFRDLHEHVTDFAWETLATPVPGTDPVKMQRKVTPLVEVEWVFLLMVYGPGGDQALRRLNAAYHLAQVQEPLMPSLVVHEVGLVNTIPEFVSQRWEDRAQCNLIVRGVSSDGFVVDVIEDHTVTFEGV